MSRPTLERAVRRRVEGLANVTLHQRCRVLDIAASDNGETVTGVRYENAGGTTQTIAADLVIDASGRGVPTLELLKSLGRADVEETTIGIDLRYATSIYEVPDDAPRDWKGVMTFGQPPEHSRGGLMLPLEGNRWMVTLGGLHSSAPSGDADDFLNYAERLRTPTMYNALRRAKRIEGVARYHFTGSVRRHFEKNYALPRGLLPIADAICRFNPVYGQGMSVAAQEACLLRRVLEASKDKDDPIAAFAPTFFAEVQAVIDTPWAVANLDFVFAETTGQRPPDFEMTLRFGAALMQLAAEDPEVHKLTAEVQNLLKPRSVYFEPTLMQRVFAKMAAAAPA